jgi:hypothetical protein
MKINKVELSATDFHPHLRARMLQRGVPREEVERTLRDGWQARDAKAGTAGKVFIFPYNADWEGKRFAEKEVTVYYKFVGGQLVVLTVKARYGESFLKGGGEGANRI